MRLQQVCSHHGQSFKICSPPLSLCAALSPPASCGACGHFDCRGCSSCLFGGHAIWREVSGRWFIRRCEILDFWHALEHAWTFARLRYGDGSAQADRWVQQIAEDLRAGKVNEVIARLKRLRPKSAEQRESLA